MKNITDTLLSRGAESLTDEQLLAVIVAEDTSDERAKTLAAELMTSSAGLLQRLVDGDTMRLRMVAGLGLRRAIRLKAAAELGRRVARAEAMAHDSITSDADVVRIMEPLMGTLQHEECWALYLASSGKVIERQRISQGGVQATVVDSKIVLKRAIELLAVQIVLVHNHPSGSAEPSRQDIELTERIAEGARLLDMRLLDHVIIARGAHYSFRGHNLIK
ncbi:MAG: DNA repair protein RadC [Alistipes sp.]|nr:DNA repair protein RadC [Alistipes sp.]